MGVATVFLPRLITTAMISTHSQCPQNGILSHSQEDQPNVLKTFLYLSFSEMVNLGNATGYEAHQTILFTFLNLLRSSSLTWSSHSSPLDDGYF